MLLELLPCWWCVRGKPWPAETPNRLIALSWRGRRPLFRSEHLRATERDATERGNAPSLAQ